MSRNREGGGSVGINRGKPAVLLGIADGDLEKRFQLATEHFSEPGSVFIVGTLVELYEQMKRNAPHVIVVADDLLRDLPLTEILRQLIDVAPVILLGPQERQTEISVLVAGGDVEFVAQVGDFVPLAASLVERRSRWAKRPEIPAGQLWGELSLDVAEIFRHEINNPLTGILGNAELVLAHGEHMSVTDTQRLRTIVDLAVRLRETIRRLSSSLQTQPHPLRSI
jgi:signal transduction histidine kinase